MAKKTEPDTGNLKPYEAMQVGFAFGRLYEKCKTREERKSIMARFDIVKREYLYRGRTDYRSFLSEAEEYLMFSDGEE